MFQRRKSESVRSTFFLPPFSTLTQTEKDQFIQNLFNENIKIKQESKQKTHLEDAVFFQEKDGLSAIIDEFKKIKRALLADKETTENLKKYLEELKEIHKDNSKLEKELRKKILALASKVKTEGDQLKEKKLTKEHVQVRIKMPAEKKDIQDAEAALKKINHIDFLIATLQTLVSKLEQSSQQEQNKQPWKKAQASQPSNRKSFFSQLRSSTKVPLEAVEVDFNFLAQFDYSSASTPTDEWKKFTRQLLLLIPQNILGQDDINKINKSYQSTNGHRDGALFLSPTEMEDPKKQQKQEELKESLLLDHNDIFMELDHTLAKLSITNINGLVSAVSNPNFLKELEKVMSPENAASHKTTIQNILAHCYIFRDTARDVDAGKSKPLIKNIDPLERPTNNLKTLLEREKGTGPITQRIENIRTMQAELKSKKEPSSYPPTP